MLIPESVRASTKLSSSSERSSERGRIGVKQLSQYRATIAALLFFITSGATASAATCPVSVAGNAAATLTVDAVLLTRYALGIRGDELTAALRTAPPLPATVETNILNARRALDVDGDGAFTSTDALILARSIAGMPSASWPLGITFATNATRKTGDALRDYVNGGCLIPGTLLGIETLASDIDTNTAGSAEAFVYTALATGTATELRLYLDATNTATTVVAGVYADGSNSPTNLLASGTINAPQSAAWNSIALSGLPITQGQRYWIALMAPVGAGVIKFRDTPGGDTAWGSSQTNLSTLPATWSTGASYNSSPASAYLYGNVSSSTGSGQTPVPGATLDTHQVYVDSGGKLVSWVTPLDKAFDRVSFLSWDFLLNRVPNDPSNNLPVIFTHSEYDPVTFAGSGWPNNPAGKNAMLADAATLYYAYSGNRGVITLVSTLLDHQLTFGTTPATYSWANVPWSTAAAGSINYGNDNIAEGVGVLEPDKIGELGYHGYLRMWQITGLTRYRDAAITCANVLAAKVRTGSANQSPWPYRVNAQSGAVVEEYTSHVIAPIRLFDELIRLNLGNVSAYQTARATAWTWLMTYPMVNNNWNQYFEDVPPQSNPFSNLNQYNAGQTARYLLERPSLDPNSQTKAAALLNWVESNFGGTDSGEAGLQYGARVISEQYIYDYKMASHTSRFGAMTALYAAAANDAVAKDKAYRSLTWATYMARSSGAVNEGPAEFQANRYFWFTDGHGDYVRHFMLAMGAFPEWAPNGENHFLKSSSVVTTITYSANLITYETFDNAAIDMLRVVAPPTRIEVDGVTLAQRTDLSAPGWTFDAGSGVLRVRRASGAQVKVVLP